VGSAAGDNSTTDAITVSSVNQFVGNVTLTATSSNPAVTVSPTSALAVLFCQKTTQVTLTISSTTHSQTATITVTGANGKTIVTAAPITVTVT
jgi:hypothetical protein